MSDPIGLFVERLWYSDQPHWRLSRALLVPASWALRGASAIRLEMYERGLLRRTRVGVPVVSIGNLSVGGTGKTPLVIWLAGRLRAGGRRPVVVGRGYGARGSEPCVISTPAHPLIAARERGTSTAVAFRHVVAGPEGWLPEDADRHVADEALLTALRTGCPVVTAPDRALACRLAVGELAADLILLDDGFQHLGLHRDLDLVLLPAQDELARVLPAGPLREHPNRLRRADLVLRETEAGGSGLRLVRRAVGLVGQVWETPRPADLLRGRTVVAAAGIARPERFFATLRELGARVRRELRFSDHHRYRPADWARIARAASAEDLLVTTEKDLVKLRSFAAGEGRLLALRVEADVAGGSELLERICKLDPRERGDHHRRPQDSRAAGGCAAAPAEKTLS